MLEMLRLVATFNALDGMTVEELRAVEKRIAIRRIELGDATIKSFKLIRFPRAGAMDITIRTLFTAFSQRLNGGRLGVDLPVVHVVGDRVYDFKMAEVLSPPDITGLTNSAVKIELTEAAVAEDAPLGQV